MGDYLSVGDNGMNTQIMPRFQLTIPLIAEARRNGMKAWVNDTRAILCASKPKGAWHQINVPVESGKEAA